MTGEDLIRRENFINLEKAIDGLTKMPDDQMKSGLRFSLGYLITTAAKVMKANYIIKDMLLLQFFTHTINSSMSCHNPNYISSLAPQTWSSYMYFYSQLDRELTQHWTTRTFTKSLVLLYSTGNVEPANNRLTQPYIHIRN